MSTLTTLTSQRVLDDTMALVRRHIPLKATGYRCQTVDLWRVLLSAMTRTHSIEATCSALAGAPHSNTVRGYLARQWTLAAIPELEAQCNATLRATMPAWVTTTPVEVAIDTHDCPYYGQIPDGDDTWVCRGKMRAGTNAHYRCATLAVTQRVPGPPHTDHGCADLRSAWRDNGRTRGTLIGTDTGCGNHH